GRPPRARPRRPRRGARTAHPGQPRLRRLDRLRIHPGGRHVGRPGLAPGLPGRPGCGGHAMNILVTGANGYIGRALAQRLCALPELPGYGAPATITLCDLALDDPPADPRVRAVAGSFADPAVLAAIADPAPDLVFHLACVASGRAEEQFELGLQVNLAGSLQLLEHLRRQGKSPGLVFTSSIAVFGAPLPDRVDDHTPTAPALSYGAHKLAMEILLADYTR